MTCRKREKRSMPENAATNYLDCALVTFSLLGRNTRHPQVKGGRLYFSLHFCIDFNA